MLAFPILSTVKSTVFSVPHLPSAILEAELLQLSCAMEKVLPAIVMVPQRYVSVLNGTENATVPLPVPLLPDVIFIQSALLTAVQLQVLNVAVTSTLPLPPVQSKVLPVGEMENSQVPLCVTVKFCPAIVMLPLRAYVAALVSVFADTE